MTLTLPTGNDTPACSDMPSILPATAMWYSGAFSQKYFKDSIASGISWTSSNIINVSAGEISTPEIARSERIILSMSKSFLKTSSTKSFLRQIMYASFAYSRRANSLIAHVFPTCRAPFNMSGFLSLRRFYSLSCCNTVLSIDILHFSTHILLCVPHFSTHISFTKIHFSTHKRKSHQHFSAFVARLFHLRLT